jgi:hypothetical protein
VRLLVRRLGAVRHTSLGGLPDPSTVAELTVPRSVTEIIEAVDSKCRAKARREPDYPNLDNPLHLAILLIEADTTTALGSGVAVLVDDADGRYLASIGSALRLISADESAGEVDALLALMARHGVTWERLRGQVEDIAGFPQFADDWVHGSTLDAFFDDVRGTEFGTDSLLSMSNAYDQFGAYLERHQEQIEREIRAMAATPTEAPFRLRELRHIQEQWSETGDDFVVNVHGIVENSDDLTTQAFRVIIASPSMIAKNLGKGHTLFGHGYLLMNDLDQRIVMHRIDALIHDARTWSDVRRCIGPMFCWVE